MTVVLLVVLHTTGTFDLAWVANHIGELALAATIQAFALSALLYIASIVNPKGLAPLGNTGTLVLVVLCSRCWWWCWRELTNVVALCVCFVRDATRRFLPHAVSWCWVRYRQPNV